MHLRSRRLAPSDFVELGADGVARQVKRARHAAVAHERSSLKQMSKPREIELAEVAYKPEKEKIQEQEQGQEQDKGATPSKRRKRHVKPKTPDAGAETSTEADPKGSPAAQKQSSTLMPTPTPTPDVKGVTAWQLSNEVLGAGSYGTVRKCVATMNGVRQVCAQKRFVTSDGNVFTGLTAEVTRELLPLCALPPHPCVLRAEAVVVHMKELYLLTPLYRCSLAQCLRMYYAHGLPEHMLQAAAVQMLHAVRHLHRHGYIHRDVKLENVLFSADGRLVLGDLGMCRRTGPGTIVAAGTNAAASLLQPQLCADSTLPLTREVCTLWTRAPEVCLMMTGAPNGTRYTEAMDVWAVGACVLACALGSYAVTCDADSVSDFLVNIWRLLGKPPRATWPLLDDAAVHGGNAFAALPDTVFPHYGNAPVVHAKLQQAAKRSLSEAACNFFMRILEQVPERRASIDEALAHPFLAGVTLDAAIATFAEACTRHNVQAPRMPPATTLRAAILLPPTATVWMQGLPQLNALPPPAFLDAQANIKARHRCLLYSWLWVVTQHFNCHSATFFDAVQLIDCYMHATSACSVLPPLFQLLGIAGLSICAKLHELYAPEPCDFVYMTDKAYTTDQLEHMEVAVATAVGGCLLLPAPLRLYDHVVALLDPPTQAAKGQHKQEWMIVTCALAAVCVYETTVSWAVSNPAAAVHAAAYVATHLAPAIVSDRVKHIAAQVQTEMDHIGSAHARDTYHVDTQVARDAAHCVVALKASTCRSDDVWTRSKALGGGSYNKTPEYRAFFSNETM